MVLFILTCYYNLTIITTVHAYLRTCMFHGTASHCSRTADFNSAHRDIRKGPSTLASKSIFCRSTVLATKKSTSTLTQVWTGLNKKTQKSFIQLLVPLRSLSNWRYIKLLIHSFMILQPCCLSWRIHQLYGDGPVTLYPPKIVDPFDPLTYCHLWVGEWVSRSHPSTSLPHRPGPLQCFVTHTTLPTV